MFKKTFLCLCGEGGNALFLLSQDCYFFAISSKSIATSLFCLLAAVFDCLFAFARGAFLPCGFTTLYGPPPLAGRKFFPNYFF